MGGGDGLDDRSRVGGAGSAGAVAVVGAGIAGLTLAVALSRAGVPCQVFEQASALAEVGAGLQLAPNATRLLHRLGLVEPLRQTAVRNQAVELRRWQDGRLLRRNEFGAAGEREFGAPYYTVHRADLHHALRELVPADRVQLGRRCVGIQELADRVVLRFADGGQASAAVVVGADGIRSAVRAWLAADQTRPSGQSVYRALVPAPRVPAPLAGPTVTMWLGPGRHCVCYPIRRGELVSVAATAPSVDEGVESWTARGRTEDLLAAYAGWDERLLRLLGAAGEVSRWALHDRDAIERWHTDRVALVGDAAHPMLPFMAQGANQAIEDAVVLAACLGATPDITSDPARALARYTRLRVARTNEVQRISRQRTQSLHVPDGAAQRSRDAALAVSADPTSVRWLFGYDAEAAAGDDRAR